MNDTRSGFGSLHMPRSRGAVSGLLLILLGAWGALIPVIGTSVNRSRVWTPSAR